MRKILTLIIFLGTITTCAQDKLTETDKLVTTGKIWGFLKYYHPEVGKGKIDWDNQLFEILPKVKNAENKKELSIVYLEWINSLGEVNKCQTCNTKNKIEYFYKNFNLNWTQDLTLFTKELITKLKFIERNRFQGNNHYVSTFEDAGNVKIQNEPEYPFFSWENKQLRLLSLFRYWNYIEYFFPYKYQMDKNWDMVLKESIPNFLNPTSETDYHLAMLELIINLNDSHGYLSSYYINSHFGNYWIPAKFQIIDEKAVITSFYNEDLSKENDLQIGDVISKVDGKDIKTILIENNKYIRGSNSSIKLMSAYNKIFNGSNTSVEIEFKRNGKIENKSIKRYEFYKFNYQKPSVEIRKLIDSNIGYINMGELEKEDVKMVMDSLSKTKAIIFDIRNYPKGTLYSISEYLNEKPKEFAKFTIPDLSYPGKFKWTEPISTGKENVKAYKGKVILLINEVTQSHAEFTAMCLQTAKNAITIGSQTSGADGNVSRIKLVGGFETMFTGLGVFYPNGKETQRIGIVPDIIVKPTVVGIKNGKDEVLEKGIQVASE